MKTPPRKRKPSHPNCRSSSNDRAGATHAGAFPGDGAPLALQPPNGTKADWSMGGWRARSNLAVFYQMYDDIQRTVAVPNVGGSPGSAVLNAAEANVFGIELQQTIQPTDNLTLQLNYIYNDPQYDTWRDPVSGADLSSTPFFFTPEHSGSTMLTGAPRTYGARLKYRF
jgi:outer membrane receptor protein involved in Fe transport